MKKDKLNEINQDSYIITKMIYYIIFNTNNKDYSNYSKMLDMDDFLVSLKEIVNYHINNGNFCSEIRNNIFDFLSFLRFKCDKLSNIDNNIINEIIVLLNSQSIDDSDMFYIVEAYKRTKDKKYIFNPYKYRVNKEYINNSICTDFLIAYSHNKEYINEETFEKDYLPVLCGNINYYYSLNAILEENPKIFLDKTFYNRVLKVFNSNLNLIKDTNISKINNKTIKKLNSKIKKI